MKKITIAIDGFSSCGKSTMAKDLAKQLGYIYVDTGAMYRAVTLFAMQHGLFNADGSVKTQDLQQQMSHINITFKFNKLTGRPDTYLNNELVESNIRTLEVSNHVSQIAAIPFVREAMVAQQQRLGKDKAVVMDGRDIGTVVFEERDYLDSHREVSPLRKAPDAIELDNSHMTIAEQSDWLMKLVKERIGE